MAQNIVVLPHKGLMVVSLNLTWLFLLKNGSPLIVLYSNDLEVTQNKIEKAGGKVIKPTFSFPGGRRFHFSDPNGNEFAVWSE
mgnify:CR=1 FL=1|jgi:predicted enzyme related to lactoylglutathione lyase